MQCVVKRRCRQGRERKSKLSYSSNSKRSTLLKECRELIWTKLNQEKGSRAQWRFCAKPVAEWEAFGTPSSTLPSHEKKRIMCLRHP